MRSCPECGAVLDDGKRSIPQLKRYFAMIKAYYANWPERCSRQFVSAKALRKWAQIRAGHFEVGITIPLIGVSKERARMLVEAAIRAVDSYAEPVIHGDSLTILKPKSIRFGSLGHLAACRLFDEVGAVLQQETGIDPEQILKETEQAA